jgi:hypothetical protein
MTSQEKLDFARTKLTERINQLDISLSEKIELQNVMIEYLMAYSDNLV